MQKLSKGSVDADRRLMAKARVCSQIVSIEPDFDGRPKQFDRTSYNDRQWHSLYVYCWQHKEDFDFVYKQASNPAALSAKQMEKMGIEIEDDEHIVMKNKTYTENELSLSKIKELRAICLAKGLPDDGDKKMMIGAILEVQELTEG